MSQRRPHCAKFTKKSTKRSDKTAIAISNGLIKINKFIDSRNTK